jgi:hypothetical protein
MRKNSYFKLYIWTAFEMKLLSWMIERFRFQTKDKVWSNVHRIKICRLIVIFDSRVRNFGTVSLYPYR